jgi:hypothetical protein
VITTHFITHKVQFIFKETGHICITQHEARSWNHCCSGKAISITYSQRVFAALGTQHAERMCHIVIRGLSSAKIFLNFLKDGKIFVKKIILHKMYALISSTTSVCNISHSTKNWAGYCQRFISVFM